MGSMHYSSLSIPWIIFHWTNTRKHQHFHIQVASQALGFSTNLAGRDFLISSANSTECKVGWDNHSYRSLRAGEREMACVVKDSRGFARKLLSLPHGPRAS